MKRKLFIAASMIAVMALSAVGFAACGGGNEGGSQSSQETPAENQVTVTYYDGTTELKSEKVEKGGKVTVNLKRVEDSIVFTVEDTGIGIPLHEQRRVYERFFRVDKNRSRATGGTGLGLAITRSIVTAHYGTIRVFSEVDAGSTFTMQIPLTHVPE